MKKKISASQQPEIDQLIIFAENPQDTREVKTALQVANCATCRVDVASIRFVIDNISELVSNQKYDTNTT